MEINKYKKRLDTLKEDLIYAVKEHYKGEYTIDSVTDSLFEKMILEQDKQVIQYSTDLYVDLITTLIDNAETFIKGAKEFDNRTLFRNEEIVNETLEDLCRTIEIFTLSIRKNNAFWQYDLSKYDNSDEDDDDEGEDEDDDADVSISYECWHGEKPDDFTSKVIDIIEELESLFKNHNHDDEGDDDE